MSESHGEVEMGPPKPTSIRVIHAPEGKKFEVTYARPVLGAITIAWTMAMAAAGRYWPATAGDLTLMLFLLSLLATSFALTATPLQPYAKVPAFAAVMTMGLYFVIACTAGLLISRARNGAELRGATEGLVVAAPFAVWVGGALAEFFTNKRSRQWRGATLFMIWTVAAGGTVVGIAGLFAQMDPLMGLPPAPGLYSYLALGGLWWIAIWSILTAITVRTLKKRARAAARAQALDRARAASLERTFGRPEPIPTPTAGATQPRAESKTPRIVKTARIVGEDEVRPPSSDPLK